MNLLCFVTSICALFNLFCFIVLIAISLPPSNLLISFSDFRLRFFYFDDLCKVVIILICYLLECLCELTHNCLVYRQVTMFIC